MHEAAALGQSIWLDFIRRSFLDSGELNELVEQGLRGVTSNPSIFQKAITASTDYDAAIERLVDEGSSVNDIYETLASRTFAAPATSCSRSTRAATAATATSAWRSTRSWPMTQRAR